MHEEREDGGGAKICAPQVDNLEKDWRSFEGAWSMTSQMEATNDQRPKEQVESRQARNARQNETVRDSEKARRYI